jgi:hypothetical protein
LREREDDVKTPISGSLTSDIDARTQPQGEVVRLKQLVQRVTKQKPNSQIKKRSPEDGMAGNKAFIEEGQVRSGRAPYSYSPRAKHTLINDTQNSFKRATCSFDLGTISISNGMGVLHSKINPPSSQGKSRLTQ